jgi:hypothetical protein
MKNVQLVIPDLFLPQQLSADLTAGLALPALETLLARANSETLPTKSLETWLCKAFRVAEDAIVPITMRADGLEPDAFYWLSADPVYLNLQRNQLILQMNVFLTAEEAAQFCSTLNLHFAADGLRFYSPHPQRWYLRLDKAPEINMHPLAQVVGMNANAYLPEGVDALRWHGVFNEIQMFLFEHAVNQAREARGELPVNSVWLWGGGYAVEVNARPYAKVLSDSHLALAFALAANISRQFFSVDLIADAADAEEGEVLVVWEGLRQALRQSDLPAWRDGLQRIENDCINPLLAALKAGHIQQLALDVPQAGTSRRFVLTRGALWKLWRRNRNLAHYTV